MQRRRIGIALGGGGARGLAHLGVLKVLEEAKIPIDCVAGTSFGALVGAMYALNPDTKAMYRKFLTFMQTPIYRHARFDRLVQRHQEENGRFWAHWGKLLKKRLVLNLAQSRMALISSHKVDSFFKFFLGYHTFAELQIPMVAASVDLVSGQEVLHTEGLLMHAVLASSAIPGILPPVFENGKILVDGVVLNSVPVRPARKIGADMVIAVDVGKDFLPQPGVENIIDIILRTHLITAHRTNALLLEEADVVITPEVGHFHWADFSEYKKIIHAGEVATRRTLPALLKNLRRNESDRVCVSTI
jgi:NTE family protein